MTGQLQADQILPAQRHLNELTCQWCATTLPAGETICATCGSPGVPDPAVELPQTENLVTAPEPPKSSDSDELHEWWLDDDEVAHQERRQAIAADPKGGNVVLTVGILSGCALLFGMLGWLAAPLFVSPIIEQITNMPVENASDVRPLGTIVGVLTGLLIGATYGWLAGSGR